MRLFSTFCIPCALSRAESLLPCPFFLFVHMVDLFNLKSKIKEQPDLGQRKNSEC